MEIRDEWVVFSTGWLKGSFSCSNWVTTVCLNKDRKIPEEIQVTYFS